ncbi:Fe2+-dependent dioxygenase [Aquabacterium fontiphilum]|uniref:Fe2+-dependent dioxygenase n=1 Tax=Aquabacterium fontiphilum TaxID=450365 RepID=UPI001377CD2B|nr:Fe2+-dependent dioxygenase [Aquabacterium fontiphilum]NBD21248.1 Fe2+-dependent dioxygenase [Aquabacterium fontiphilum]
MLLSIPDVLSLDDVRNVRTLLDQGVWRDGRATAGGQAIHAKQNEQLRTDSDAAQAAQEQVLQALQRSALFFSAALPNRIFPPQFNRYSGDTNTYGDHVDGAVMHTARTGDKVRSDVSCTLFLTDPADYEGGELVIQDTYGTQRVKLPAGHMVLYPSTSVHRVEPVTRGARVSCFFWVQSMVRSDEQRRLLFDLDMNLLRLRQQGESAVTVGLTGTYHNLLRMWAEV